MLHLLENGLVTAETLARDLDVTQRTVYREISFLRDEGHRILGAAGAGYMLRPGSSLGTSIGEAGR